MTLAQTAILTKQVVVVSIITVIVSLTSFVGYKIWYAHYLASLPPVEEKPDIKFGPLPKPDFPPAFVSSSNYTYSLDTSTGGLPKIGVDPGFDKLVKVYFIIKPYATFLSPDKSQSLADKFGFNSAPQVLNETTYSYKEGNKNLVVDLDSGNFKYTKDSTPSASPVTGDDSQLVGNFQNILSTLGALRDEFKTGRSKIIRNSSTVTISLWPADINKKQIITSNLDRSLVNATVTSSASDLTNYLGLNYTFFQVDQNTFATYPLKNPEDAFTDLKAGQGVVLVEPPKPQVSITSVSLDYFMPDKYNPYLQPVFLFEGPGFAALVPAVSNQFIKTN